MLNNPIRNNVYIFLVLTIGIQKAPLNAATLIVDQSGNGDYFYIADAYAAVDNDIRDTIIVRAGTYTENIGVMDKPVVLIGVDRNSVFWIDANAGYNNIVDFSHPWLIIEDITFSQGIVDISVFERIEGCVFDDSWIMTCGSSTGGLTFMNSIFKNSQYLFQSNNCGGGPLEFINCVAYNINGSNGHMRTNSSITVTNCIFSNVGAFSPQDDDSRITITYSCLYNSENYDGGYQNVSNSPSFVDPSNNDFRLQSSSPCIDTGSVISLYNDPDGSRNDMGVYGGPNSLGGSGPIITNLIINPTSAEVGATITIQATATTE